MRKQKNRSSGMTENASRLKHDSLTLKGAEKYNKASKEKAERKKQEKIIPSVEYYYDEYDEYLSS